jgi:DNA-binding IclR family transcriptional regulator
MIQVLHRAFDILELCASDKEKAHTLSEIAEKLQLNPTTCANIIKTMVTRNYLEQVGYKKGYRLGAKAFHLTGKSPDE